MFGNFTDNGDVVCIAANLSEANQLLALPDHSASPVRQGGVIDYSMLIDSELDEINTISLLTALQTVLVKFLGQEIRVDSFIGKRELEIVGRISRRKATSYHG